MKVLEQKEFLVRRVAGKSELLVKEELLVKTELL